jgi:NADH:ubiquinone oxidoreductase subunit H
MCFISGGHDVICICFGGDKINRVPSDLGEGESELVSGFNVEYSFKAEYCLSEAGGVTFIYLYKRDLPRIIVRQY